MENPRINTYHSGNFLVAISNIPTVKTEGDLHIYHNFIRSVSLPGFEIGNIDSPWQGEHYMNTASHKNSDLSNLSITFKLDSTLLNYYYMAEYVNNMRYGVNDTRGPSKQYDVKPVSAIRQEIPMKKNVIAGITISILDNQKNVVGHFTYKNCVPASISSLDVNYYSSDEIEFTVAFKFQEVHFGNKD